MHKDPIKNIKKGLLRNPFELAICLITMLSIGNVIKLLLTNPTILAKSNDPILSLPSALLWIWCVMGFFGGFLMVFGLTMSAFSVRGMDLEISGLWLAATIWLSASVISIFEAPTKFNTYGQYVSISMGCAFRILALAKLHRVVIDVTEDGGK